MNQIKSIITIASNKAREKRKNIFLNKFNLNNDTVILDVGSEDGSNIHSILKGTKYRQKMFT